jgi:hypothetical protein
VDAVIRWLTGCSEPALAAVLKNDTDRETFLQKAPRMNPHRALIRGVVCGVRVEEVAAPTMREIRFLNKLEDELAKGRALEKVLRA